MQVAHCTCGIPPVFGNLRDIKNTITKKKENNKEKRE
jgi:hypothetical protein